MYDQIQSTAHELRLFGIHNSLERRCQEALSENLHPSELVRLLLEDERDARRRAVAKRLATQAKFRNSSSLEEWDQSFDRGITKAKLKELSLLNFYHKRQNLLIIGKTGVGKTHLAISLGKRLCDDGAKTRFFSTNLFFEEVAAEKAAGTYLRFVKRIVKLEVLILDDFALRSYSHDEANILQDILEERYGKGVTILTSQVSPTGWKTLFEDAVIAESITDRLRNPAEEINLKGNSYRDKKGSN